MTAQIGDIYKFRDKEYTIVAMSNPRIFSPKRYGLEPHMIHTGCRRGYCCEYEIREDSLYLNKLYLYNEFGNYPPLRGVCAVKADGESAADYDGFYLYNNLNLKRKYTGKLMLGTEFIYDYYIHMGFQQGWAYNELIELQFDKGKLISVADFSDEAEKMRNLMKEQNIDTHGHGAKNVVQFISDAFSLDYEAKKWWT